MEVVAAQRRLFPNLVILMRIIYLLISIVSLVGFILFSSGPAVWEKQVFSVVFALIFCLGLTVFRDSTTAKKRLDKLERDQDDPNV